VGTLANENEKPLSLVSAHGAPHVVPPLSLARTGERSGAMNEWPVVTWSMEISLGELLIGSLFLVWIIVMVIVIRRMQ
jgi:hypothetical protein